MTTVLDGGFTYLNKIQNGDNVLLRDYGGTNLIELFSVCLESFFENSYSFCDKEPELYNSLVLLLKQNPLNKSNPLNTKPILFQKSNIASSVYKN